jgi:protein-disulfide isomerase
MTSSRPSKRPSPDGGVPPMSRRSTRQQRIFGRDTSRALARAGTHGGGGRAGRRRVAFYSVGAVIVVALVAGAALVLLGGKGSPSGADLPEPIAPQPSQMTLSTVPRDGLVLGNPDAAHTIAVWADYQCLNCRMFALDFEPQLISEWVATGRAKLVWHDWAVNDTLYGGTESRDAANAARCANDQGKFWEYHDWLFTNQFSEGSGAFSRARLKTIARLMGIPDQARFDACVDGGTHNAEVAADAATRPSGATYAPSVAVDGTLQASYDTYTISGALNAILGITPSPSVSASPSATASASGVGSPSPSESAAGSPSLSPGAS